jgi:hypothetical protein
MCGRVSPFSNPMNHLKKIAYLLLYSVFVLDLNAQVTARPFYSQLQAVAKVTLPNLIQIDGAASKNINLVKISGPGKFVYRDKNWYWEWKPDTSTIDSTYKVRFSVVSKGKRLTDSEFGVTVNPRQRVQREVIRPTDDLSRPIAYGGVLTQINGLCKNLTGDYRIDVKLDGEPYRSFLAGVCEFKPEFITHWSHVFCAEIYFRPLFARDYQLLDSISFPYELAPLNATFPRYLYEGDSPLIRFKVAYGIEGNFSEGPAFIEVRSEDSVFSTIAYSSDLFPGRKDLVSFTPFSTNERPDTVTDSLILATFEDYKRTPERYQRTGINYILRVAKFPDVTDPKGKDIDIVLHDLYTGQAKFKSIRFFPKRGGAIKPEKN